MASESSLSRVNIPRFAGGRCSLLLTTRDDPDVCSGFPLTCRVRVPEHHSRWGSTGCWIAGCCPLKPGWANTSRQAAPPSTCCSYRPAEEGLIGSPWASFVDEISYLVYPYWFCFPHKMVVLGLFPLSQEGGVRLAMTSRWLLRRGRNEAGDRGFGGPSFL